MDDAMRAKVTAFEQTVRSTLALAETFEAADWIRPTECPGWTIKDQIAHLVGVERMLLGDVQPAHEPPPDLPRVRNDFGRVLEVAVDARRSVPGAEIVAELGDALERRLAALPGIDPERQVKCPDGRMGSYTRFMAFRALDCWTHEQDIRRAVGRPGNLDAPASQCFWEIFGRGLPIVVAARAKAAPGQSADFTIVGPPSFRSYVVVDENGRGEATTDASGKPTVALRMSWETYVRLTAGRCGPETVKIDIDGDRDLADRILANMTLTP
jgi:uncharacterized protein (TIGR03083 family)